MQFFYNMHCPRNFVKTSHKNRFHFFFALQWAFNLLIPPPIYLRALVAVIIFIYTVGNICIPSKQKSLAT